MKPCFIAHRGYSGKYLQNTEESFIKAVEHGSGGIETDVRITKDGVFVVAFIDGEFTLKEFRLDEANNCAWLIPHNKDFAPIKVTEDNDFMIWGVLTYTIKQLRK